jgi:hypothetical protein
MGERERRKTRRIRRSGEGGGEWNTGDIMLDTLAD